MTPTLAVTDLVKHFPIQKGLLAREVGQVRAVDGVSFAVAPGETLCVVGESGCGKSTVGRLILRLLEPTAGTITFEGRDVGRLSRSDFRPLRQELQIVFQDPYASLNPRMRAGAIVGEPLENFGTLGRAERKAHVAELFAKVGLPQDAMDRYAFEFSGGQRQRLGIARALAVAPKLIVADEPVSALDVSVQAQVLNLMMDLKAEFGLAYLFISHDLGVVEHVADRVAVMYLGQIVEIGTRAAIFAEPRHPYTKALMSAAPRPDPRAKRERIILEGDVPSPASPPAGCRFHTRCPFAFDRCRTEVPTLRDISADQKAACHLDEVGSS
ncbi:MAG: dipeptide ABC transporter ATP-binding protein [Pseudomonadota bacterium]